MMKITRFLPPVAVVAALLAWSVPVLAQDTAPKPNIPLQKTIGQVTATGPVPSLFVVNSEGASLKDGKLILTGVDQNVIVFSDRPVRSAGHLMTAQAIQQWDADKDNFINDPPNGTVSVLAGEGSDVEDAVVTLTNPVLVDRTLTFDVVVLEGALTKSGPAALFIDNGGFHGGGDFRGGGGFRGADVHVNSFHGGNYYHAPDYHGAWYRTGAVAAGVVTGAAVGAAIAHTNDYYGGYDNAYNDGYGAAPPGYAYPPYCGYYPYLPCY